MGNVPVEARGQSGTGHHRYRWCGPGTSALVASESIELWKDYLRFHLIEHYSSVLPKAVRAEDFAFYGAIVSGAQQMPERSTGAIAATIAPGNPPTR